MQNASYLRGKRGSECRGVGVVYKEEGVIELFLFLLCRINELCFLYVYENRLNEVSEAGASVVIGSEEGEFWVVFRQVFDVLWV